MKFYGSVVTSCFLLLSAFGCRPKADSSVTGIAGEKPKKGNCSDVNDWSASPVTCQKDKSQVVVHRVFEHNGVRHTRIKESILNWADRAKRVGIHTCFGEISHFSGGKWRSGAGVWLNGQGGLGGCHPGTGYRNITSGAKGANVVTPVIQDNFSVHHRGIKYYDLVLPTMQSKKIGVYKTKPVSPFEYCDGCEGMPGTVSATIDLCTGEFEKVCDIAISEGTLKIELRSSSNVLAVQRGDGRTCRTVNEDSEKRIKCCASWTNQKHGNNCVYN